MGGLGNLAGWDLSTVPIRDIRLQDEWIRYTASGSQGRLQEMP